MNDAQSRGAKVMVKIPKAPKEVASEIKPKNVCVNCGRHHQKKLVTCGKCKTTRYCNAKCQKADWDSHKIYCGGLDKAFATHANDKFMKDVEAHLITCQYFGKHTVLNNEGNIWRYHEEDERGYWLLKWTVSQLLAHLKTKCSEPEHVLKWHISELLKGTTFLVFKEGQVMALKTAENAEEEKEAAVTAAVMEAEVEEEEEEALVSYQGTITLADGTVHDISGEFKKKVRELRREEYKEIETRVNECVD